MYYVTYNIDSYIYIYIYIYIYMLNTYGWPLSPGGLSALGLPSRPKRSNRTVWFPPAVCCDSRPSSIHMFQSWCCCRVTFQTCHCDC